MLQLSIIKPSTSSFSSSVLLVKKKDNTWRFGVEFCHLNAITVKSVFPVPMIEELLDELGQAAWFSSLDLTAGYHQILCSHLILTKHHSKRIQATMNFVLWLLDSWVLLLLFKKP